MELGVISLSDIQTDPDTAKPYGYRQRLAEIVSYATLADRLGLDVFALDTHHTLDFAVSSPAVALAAIAARNSRIRLTSGVTSCLCCTPCGSTRDYDAVFSEKLDLLLQLHDNDYVTWSGMFWPPLHNAAITPRAHQQPLPAWLGVGGWRATVGQHLSSDDSLDVTVIVPVRPPALVDKPASPARHFGPGC